MPKLQKIDITQAIQFSQVNYICTTPSGANLKTGYKFDSNRILIQVLYILLKLKHNLNQIQRNVSYNMIYLQQSLINDKNFNL